MIIGLFALGTDAVYDSPVVMAGLVPAIHVLNALSSRSFAIGRSALARMQN